MIEKPFQGNRTFCKISDQNFPNYTHAVIGMGVDSGTTFRSGARLAPAAIREASMMLTDGVNTAFPIDIKKHTFDLGDLAVTNGNTSKMLQQVETSIKNVLAWGKHPVILGGEHTITLGALRAMHASHGKLAVIHFDAHCDTRSMHFDEPIGHGTWLYNAITEGLVDPVKVISIGIRSPTDYNTQMFLNDKGGTTFTARYAYQNMDAVVSNIKKLVEDYACYLTFDIDCLDPAYAPGTGTPEVGGLTTMWALECLERLHGINFVGMDCVEVAPAYDHSNITALAAATICWTYISMVTFKQFSN